MLYADTYRSTTRVAAPIADIKQSSFTVVYHLNNLLRVLYSTIEDQES